MSRNYKPCDELAEDEYYKEKESVERNCDGKGSSNKRAGTNMVQGKKSHLGLHALANLIMNPI